jgi:hypothetical protein
MARFKYSSDYLSSVFNTPLFIKKVNKMALKIKAFRKKNKFQAIAFTGVSGTTFASALSYKLGIPLICIRKANDKSHSSTIYEGRLNVKSYIIVDDFITYFTGGMWNQTVEWFNDLFASKEVWYLNQKEIDLLTCDASKKPLDFKSLPSRKKTIRLYYQDLKSKVCKPFSR